MTGRPLGCLILRRGKWILEGGPMRARIAVLTLCFLLVCGLAGADFRVGDTVDVVYLVDGTKIEGTVIAVGIKAVVVVVKGEKEGEAKEVVIPKTKVERIERGDAAKDTASFKTDTIEGTKRVTGQGFREEQNEPLAPEAKEEPESNQPAKPTGPANRNLRKLIEDAMGSNPTVKTLVKQAGGVDQAVQVLQGNPQLMNRFEGYLNQGAQSAPPQRRERPDRRRPGGGRR